MSESNLAERSDGRERLVSGAKVVAQALKTQVCWTFLIERLLRRPTGAETLSWKRESGGEGRGELCWRFSF